MVHSVSLADGERTATSRASTKELLASPGEVALTRMTKSESPNAERSPNAEIRKQFSAAPKKCGRILFGFRVYVGISNLGTYP
jgi:hypothetical protein